MRSGVYIMWSQCMFPVNWHMGHVNCQKKKNYYVIIKLILYHNRFYHFHRLIRYLLFNSSNVVVSSKVSNKQNW